MSRIACLTSALPLHMCSTPLCQRLQQAADQCCAPCGLTPHLCPRRLVITPPDWPCLPSLRSARLGKSSAVTCTYLDAVAKVVLQNTCHMPPHPRRSPQLIAYQGTWATRQCGGPAPREHSRADRLSGVSRLAHAAAPGLTTVKASSTYVWTRASMPTQRLGHEAT